MREGCEFAVVDEVSRQGQGDLAANGGNLQLCGDEAEVLDGAGTTDGAVAYERRRLVVPLRVDEVDRVFQRTRSGMVVLRSDEDVAVKFGNLRRPRLGVLIRVLAHRCGDGLIKVREVEVKQVDYLVGCVGALLRDLVDPLGDGEAVASGAGASDDDGDL